MIQDLCIYPFGQCEDVKTNEKQREDCPKLARLKLALHKKANVIIKSNKKEVISKC